MGFMAEESAGPDQSIGTPDESQALAADSPEELDSALAKQLNLDQLPDDPQEFKRAVIKRTRELRNIGRKSGEDSKAKLTALEQKLDLLTQFVAPRVPQAPAQSGPPAGGSDEEVLNWYLDRRIEQKYGNRFSAIDRLAEMQANQMVEAARVRYPDFDELEGEITAALQKYEGMDLDTAYRLARSATADDRAAQRIQSQLESKRGVNTLSSPGTPSSGLKEPDPATTDSRSYMDWAFKQAKEQAVREDRLVTET